MSITRMLSAIFSSFLEKYKISNVDFYHNSYHHFVNQGASDSQLDVLLFLGPKVYTETLEEIICGLEDGSILSHHDAIVSSFPVSKL